MELTEKRRFGATKVGLALAAAGALVLGGLAPAHAAEVYIGPDAVASYEDGREGTAGYNYDQWHISSNDLTKSDGDINLPLDEQVTFNENSVTFGEHVTPGSWVGLLKGYPIDQRPTFASGDEDALKAFLDGLSVDVVEGPVTIQLPVFGYFEDQNGDTERRFATIRSVHIDGSGGYSLSSGSAIGFYDTELTYEQLVNFFNISMADGGTFEILGVGVNGRAGAEVSSLTFDGNTYLFGTEGAPTPEPTPANTALAASWDSAEVANVCPATTASTSVNGAVENYNAESALVVLTVVKGRYTNPEDEAPIEDFVVQGDTVEVNADGTFEYAVDGLEAGVYTAAVALVRAEDDAVFAMEHVTVTIDECGNVAPAPKAPQKVDTAA